MKDTKLVAALGDISSDILMLPESTGSLQGLKKHGKTAITSRGTTDIWRGDWNSKPVAFKAFRINAAQDLLEAKKTLWKLAPIWKRLVHENVLQFHGVDTSLFQLALVYEWGQNGNITQYLESNPDASRVKLVIGFLYTSHSLFLIINPKLLQVAKGLRYLHSIDIVHGNLRGVSEVLSRIHAKLMKSGKCADIHEWKSPGL